MEASPLASWGKDRYIEKRPFFSLKKAKKAKDRSFLLEKRKEGKRPFFSFRKKQRRQKTVLFFLKKAKKAKENHTYGRISAVAEMPWASDLPFSKEKGKQKDFFKDKAPTGEAAYGLPSSVNAKSYQLR